MRSRRGRTTVAALLLVFAGTAWGLTLPCPSGRFDVQGQPLIGGGSSDAVSLTGAQASTVSGCALVEARIRGTAKGTRVRAVWSSCGPYLGPHRLVARIDAATCNTMTGKFRSKGVRPAREFVATRTSGGCSTAGQATFDVIQQRIFSHRGCNVSTCHGTFPQANLDLRTGASYGAIINVPADNAVAAAAGKVRVLPGNAAASFLAQKVHGTQGAGEGSLMPLVGSALPQMELDLLDAWINAGAPQTGQVSGAPCLPPLQYVATDPPPVPVGGYQIVLNGPTLQPGQESEGCFWVPVPNATDFYTGKWEFALNPGTHHFAVYSNRIPNPPLNTWLQNDFGCFQEAEYGASLSGAPQAPYYVDNYPPGIARVLKAGTYIGLNAHYHNDFAVPIQMKVWTNIYPYNGTPQHIAKTLTSLDTTFNISVPAFQQKIQHGRFVNSTGLPMSFITLSGHMHKRGLRFTVWRSNGTQVYENFDWAHPVGILYSPPLVLGPGDWLDYECLHDNGVTRPVKTDVFGNPTTLLFGVTTDDEMCILPGTYYTD